MSAPAAQLPSARPEPLPLPAAPTPAPVLPLVPTADEPAVPTPIRPRRRIMDFPTTFLTYTGAALILVGVVGILTSGALQATDGQPGGTCRYNGQVLTGGDCVSNFTQAYQIGYGASAGTIAVGGLMLGGGLFRYYRRTPLWPDK